MPHVKRRTDRTGLLLLSIWRCNVKRIDLEKYYPYYNGGHYFVEVSDEIAELLEASQAAERAYRRKMRYHKVILLETVQDEQRWGSMHPLSGTTNSLDNVELRAALIEAFSSLTPLQARRALAYFVCRYTTAEIARREMVSESTIKSCIRGVRRKLANKLNNFILGTN